MIKEKEERRSGMYIFSSIFLVAVVLLCLFISMQVLTNGYASFGGYSVFRVVTGSMEPTIPTGCILLNKKTEIEEIQINDIVCFKARVAEIRGSVVTHRVTKVLTDQSGNILLETRGDANVATDPYYVDETNLIGRIIWQSGKENVLTNMLSFLSGKFGFFACIVFPLLLVSGLILQGAVRNMKKDIYSLREEMLRVPEDDEDDSSVEEEETLLPGYTTLTQEDYQAVYETLKRELTEDLYGLVEESDSKTE
ncbi:MAG: signal peptidase I [Oscillospiraceae bacterium]|nr:signal peptidase I [Oscillospiraceae bacterium]